MTNPFKISLRPHEKIYINGAVLRFDRRTSVEFLNDVNFLLEAHVMQLEDAVSPMQRLYYIIQIILISPENAGLNKTVYARQIELLKAEPNGELTDESLREIDRLVCAGKLYDAMKFIRKIDSSVTARREDRNAKEMGKPVPVPIKAA
jgi:flagellar protein FlbT